MSWITGILEGLGQAGDLIGSILGPLLGAQNNDRTNATNAALTQATNAANLQATREANENNLKLGAMNYQAVQDTNAMNKQLVDSTNALNERLQRAQWARDDTSYQRMVADMNAAGLNPLSQFNSPASSSLSTQMQSAQMQAPQNNATMQAARFNAAQIRPFDFSHLGDGFYDFANSIAREKELNLQNKALNLKAITSGVNPILLDDSSDSDELVNFFRQIFEANLKEQQKNANSPYVKGEGSLSKMAKDVSSVYQSVRGAVKAASGNDLNDLPKVLKEVEVKDARSVVPPSEYSKRVEEYYYNSAHKNKNSSGRAFGNYLRSKVFKR